MRLRQLQSEDIEYAAELRPNYKWPRRYRVYASLKGLSCVSCTLWIDEGYKEETARAMVALTLNRKLAEHVRKMEEFCEYEHRTFPN